MVYADGVKTVSFGINKNIAALMLSDIEMTFFLGIM